MDPSDNAWKRELGGAHHRGVRDNGIGVLWPGTDRCRTDTGNVAGGKTQLGGIRGSHSLTKDCAGKRTFTNAEAGGGYRVHTNSRHTQQERLSETQRPLCGQGAVGQALYLGKEGTGQGKPCQRRHGHEHTEMQRGAPSSAHTEEVIPEDGNCY